MHQSRDFGAFPNDDSPFRPGADCRFVPIEELLVNDDSPNPFEPPRSDEHPSFLGSTSKKPHDSTKLNDKLVVLALFDNSIDAHSLKNVLEQNGIDATVNNETITAIFGSTIAGPSSAFSVEVVIRQSDKEAALAIKQQFLSSLPVDSAPIPEWKCKCGETVEAGFEVCWNCEAEYHG